MKVLMALMMLMLSGCFLAPESGTSPQVGGRVLQGAVEMRDIQGAIHKLVENVESYVIAYFGYDSDTVPHNVLREAIHEPKRALQCDVERKKTTRSMTARDLVSIGRAFFNGQAMQKDAEYNIYTKVLSLGYPAGFFRFTADGTDSSGALSEVISMPEELRGARVDNADMTTEGPVISQAKALQFEWDPPKDLNKSNYIGLEVSALTASERVTVFCYIQEADLWTDAPMKLSLTIPQSYVGQLPESSDVDVQLQRIHQMQPANGTVVASSIFGYRVMETLGVVTK